MVSFWKTAVIILSIALPVTACGAGTGMQGADGGGTNTGQRANKEQGHLAMLSGNGPATVPFQQDGDEKYVSVDTIAQLLQYKHFEAEGNTRKIGDNDVVLRLTAGSLEGEKEGDFFRLSHPPKMVEGQMMLTLTDAVDLFAEEMVFDITGDALVIYPSDADVSLRDTDGPDDETVDPSLDFADDPNDPFKEDIVGAFRADDNHMSPEEAAMAVKALEAIAADPKAVPVLKDIDINGLIRTSKKYMGVKYRFGADPYPESNRFDCSSFTQYVFDKYGIELPRTAREQMKLGKTVSRKSLRKGDLLFFYVPGRFKSKKVAGHVGIYIGNRTMIHANTEPKNGVQLRSIDRAFWKKTFIKAKRIAR